MKYAAVIEYSQDREKVEAARPAHRAYLTTLIQKGELFASGPFEDGYGALIVYEADSPEVVEALMAADPFRVSPVAPAKPPAKLSPADVVAAGVAIYHWTVLRADAAARPAKLATAAPVIAKMVPVAVVATPSATEPAPAAEALGPHARHFTLVVNDATDDDVHQALAALPPQASYKLTPTEQTL